MRYIATYDAHAKVCTVQVAGRLICPGDGKKLRQVAINQRKLFLRKKFLFDMTEADIFSNTMAAFDVANPGKEQAVILRFLKGAILYRDLTDHERFFETVAVNRGFRIKVFDTRDEAIDWLSPEF